MIFAYDNKLDDYTLTAPEFSDLYPVENVIDKRLEKLWKGNDSDTTQRIVIDCGTATIHALVVILGHNLTSSQTVKIEGNTSDSWTSPAYSQTLTVSDFMFALIGGGSYQFWSIVISGIDITVPPEIGYLYLGDYIIMPHPSKLSNITYRNQSLNSQSESGTLYGYRSDTTMREFKIDWSWLEDAELAAFEAMLEVVEKSIPVILIWDLAITYTNLKNLYCFFPEDLILSDLIFYQYGNYSIAIKECK